MHDSVDLSVVIVTWNSGNEIGECLEAVIENTTGLNYEIVIVDNNSSDNTSEITERTASGKFHRLKFIQNTENAGFTRACNQGILSSSGKAILLLNPDTRITGNAITNLLAKLNSDENYGAAAPQLLNEDGTIQSSCRTFPSYFDMFCELSFLSYFFPFSRKFARWKMRYFSHDKEAIVEQPMAAALMIKKKALYEINNFDERYNMFFNDVDLCRQIYGRNYEIVFYPGSKVIHSKGVSIYKDRQRMIRVWNNDCLKYFRKFHYNFFLYYWLLVSLKLSGWLRILLLKLKK